MNPSPERSLTLVGAGLAGALLATLLARRGWSVDVFEKRPDPRSRGYEGGRSINLALAERGLNALRLAGLQDAVMAQAVMMRGRMVHPPGGGQQLQRYGRDDSEVIWSVHRGRLNIAMLDAAEAAGARLHFNRRLDGVDFDARRARFVNDHDRDAHVQDFEALLGCDGAGSGLREAMRPRVDLGERFEPLGHGYKELEIPPDASGGFRIEPHALHIWPRGGYMCIALPNTEQTFTVTLFLPMRGDPSFATLPDLAAARDFFARDFADALPLVPDFDADWTNNPVSGLGTLSLQRWHLDGRAVLLGDAAHAMVPFHGQGMNCAFEDCVALDRHLAASPDFAAAFAAFEAERRPNADAIQAMALENYVEMRDRVDDADWLLQRALERVLAERHPGRFVPRYSMVSFLRVPYATAFARGKVQRAILVQATQGKAGVEEVDLAAADAQVLAQLDPLE
ncbi:FAD-dependent oxidoreductase [Arenimonas sp. MALMAid1274]|uniref:FAD-dependent oxidoreductase n=1 Tax=Arenimonas sp. MALMAid1274 TaxID=3411630 RepID=UPI003BA25688